MGDRMATPLEQQPYPHYIPQHGAQGLAHRMSSVNTF